ncbi:Hypothetical Protein OBI_RACECAR_265 [Arthrobacter phage Racecar]|nr:hypothetical protein PBI_RACECAR_57 [Arthrobacter phage Racecar]QFG12741.1 hypothetical protein PBI_MIMI_57 [Arthrobacter phage Mimi]
MALTEEHKVKVGAGFYVEVVGLGSNVILNMGTETEEWGQLGMTQWETFQVIQKLAEVSGLSTGETLRGGIIVDRPENPRERERIEELSAKFTNGEWEFEQLDPAAQRAVMFIVNTEFGRSND